MLLLAYSEAAGRQRRETILIPIEYVNASVKSPLCGTVEGL